MERILFTALTVLIGYTSAYSADRYWVANAASNWNNMANWSSTNGGAGGATIPIAGDRVLFNGNGIGNCTLDVNANFDGLNTTGYLAVIDLNGFTFNPSVSIGVSKCIFGDGTIIDGLSTQSLNFTTNDYVRFINTTFNLPLTISANGLSFDGGLFNGSVDVTLTGTTSLNGVGGCTFNSTLKVTTISSNAFIMGYTNPDIFNGVVTLINNGTNRISIAYNSPGNQFNDNIIVGSTAGTGVFLCEGINSTATLANTKVINIDAGGFSFGELRLRNFTQLGATAQNLSLSGSAILRFQLGCVFNGSVNFDSPQIYMDGVTFNSTADLEKTGAGSNSSIGNNVFIGNCILRNSGSGYFTMGSTNSDDFQNDLTLHNTGTSRMYIANTSIGNTVGGNLTINNPSTGALTHVFVANSSVSEITITGNVICNNNSNATNSSIYLGNDGDVTINGVSTLNNNALGDNGHFYIGANANSLVTFNNTVTVSNGGAGITKRIYFGNNGNIICNAPLLIKNSSSAANSQIYCNRSATSTNMYNDNVIVESTNTLSDGVLFGDSGGIGTLAATKVVTIGAGGFIAGYLQFRNFTQVGNTTQSLTCTGTTLFYNYDSDWGGDVNFISPRMLTRGTIYNRTSYIEKTGAFGDVSDGGNTFVMNSELKNSGAGYFSMGNGDPDIFQANLIANNIGSSSIYIGSNSIGNTVAGSFTANNSGNGVYSVIFVCNQATSDITLNGTVLLNNSGTSISSFIYLGYEGDITINAPLNIINSSSSTSSYVACNYGANSTGIYNDNITVQNTSLIGDGVTFGGAGGNGTLAASKTITIGAGGFIGGQLQFRNFTQVGNTVQNLTCTGSALIYNYDSNWGGDVTFLSPRIVTRGTMYSRTAYIEKTGALSDFSTGGNTFMMNTELKNSGSGAFAMGNINSDDFQADLILNNTGTHYLYLAYGSIGNTVAGIFTLNNTGTGANTGINIANSILSDITVSGITAVNNLASSISSFFYFGNSGDVILNNNLTLNNNATGASGQIYVANGAASSLIVNGSTTLLNSGAGTTKRTYLGYNGDVTLNGVFSITNSSSATNSQVYCNSGLSSSNLYNENIILESTDASCDGVIFGVGGGVGTLVATKTVNLGAGGFISGNLQFRNFTQVGNTAQSLTCTGTTLFYNYDSDWGGDVNFISPRMLTRGTIYNRTSYIEKTGASDNYSQGGNTFVMNSELRNTGSGILGMGNGSSDAFQSNLLINNLGTRHIYMAYNSAGNTIDGNLTVNNIGVSGNTYIYFANNVASTVTISGITQINNLSTSTNSNIFFPSSGDIILNNSLIIDNNLTATAAYVSLAHAPDASLLINGVTIVNNAGGNSLKRIFLGNQGDITFNGTLDIINASSATNSQVYCNYSVTSNGLYNDNITVESTNANCDGVLFGNANGVGTLAANKTITINAGGFISGYLSFRNFTQLSATPQTLLPTGTSRIENYDSQWNGNVDFRAPHHHTRGTTYNGTAFLEKNGVGNDASFGGNTFNQDAIMKVTNSGYFMPAIGDPNDFNANATYVKTSTGLMYPGYNCINTYAGDVNIESTTSVRFGAAVNGRTLFDGTIAQSINIVGATPKPEFRDIETQNPNAEITLNTPITILSELDLQQGNLISTTANLIYANDNSIVSNVSDSAFVDGPLEKIGNDAYIYPVGKVGVYRPIEISAPVSGLARFRGEFFAADVVTDGIPDTPVELSINHISDCEYWILDRIATINPVNVTLSYKDYSANNCSGVLVPSDLVVARWDGGIWRDHGNGGVTGGATFGTVVTSAAVTSFSPFTLATITDLNPLPVELIEFTATNNQDVVDILWVTASEINNDYYMVERSADGVNFDAILKQDGAGNSIEILTYFDVDRNPLNELSYYRLKQTDFDGEASYSNVVSVNRKDESTTDVTVYPNPVNDIVNISVSISNYSVNVFSVDGRLIQSTLNVKSLDMTTFSKGIYHFVVKDLNGLILKTIKVIKA